MIEALLLLPLAPLIFFGGVLAPVYQLLAWRLQRAGRDHRVLKRTFLRLWLVASLALYAMLAVGVVYPPRFSWLLDFLERGGAMVLVPLFVINFISFNIYDRKQRGLQARNQLN